MARRRPTDRLTETKRRQSTSRARDGDDDGGDDVCARDSV
jgi:hypothetical protein